MANTNLAINHHVGGGVELTLQQNLPAGTKIYIQLDKVTRKYSREELRRMLRQPEPPNKGKVRILFNCPEEIEIVRKD